LLVNRRGERFGDECDQPALRVAEQEGKQAWILLDQRLARQFSAWPHFVSTAPGVAYAYVPDYLRNRPDVTAQAPTLQALAQTLGMDPDALAASARPEGKPALGEGPYIALGPVRAVFAHAEGGKDEWNQPRCLYGVMLSVWNPGKNDWIVKRWKSK
jgi:fumarate reductase flavoprotein subunit